MIPREILKKIRQIELRTNRLVKGVACASVSLLSLVLLCSCAIKHSGHARLPADLEMNQHAGLGDLLYVIIRLNDGEQLPFVLDTGSPATFFDASLKPRLGKCFGSTTAWNFGSKREAEIYASPKLYLGNAELMMTGSNVLTCDFRRESSVSGSDYPTMGILGMDVLEHYCVQLDFEGRKIRFLTAGCLTPDELGRRFPLDPTGDDGRVFISSPSLLANEKVKLLVDTGFQVDGASNGEAFDKIVKEHNLKIVSDCALLPKCDWNGGSYTNLIILNGDGLLGLRFLARHLVTFDFPNRRMYLKQRRIGPLDNNLESHFAP